MTKIRQKNKTSITRSIFLLSLISLSGLILLGCNLINPEQYDGETISLKSSDNEITIITPENITYTAPMGGYYPATYGFENDEDGSDPEGWILNENPPNYEIEVVSEKEGRKKVVHFYDNENEWRSMNHYPDGDPTTGTIELWVLGADVTDSYIGITMRDTTGRRGFTVVMGDDKWQYFDTVGFLDISNVGTPQDNTWHHLRLDFRCAGASVYKGLSVASYKIMVDGKESGEMPFYDTNANNLDRFPISTDAGPNSEWWVDAISFSWDPNYNIGDNLNEGLLLSFDNSTTLDWMGYSLDGLANKTIIGNATLPLPTNGVHNIQMFGNNSLGTIVASNLRYFTLDVPVINIITPENKTYIGPMSGYYPGTYGFENDQIGSVPQGWVDDSLGSGIVEVIQEEDQHKKLLHIQSGLSSNNQGNPKLKFPDLTIGTVEYWIKFDDVNPPAHYIYAAEIEDNDNAKVSIRIRSNEWTYYDGSVYQTICPAEVNKWYHLRVDWDMISDTSDIYVYHADKTLAGSVLGATNRAAGTTVNSLAITMHNAVTDTNIWVDAVGVSWDPNYNLGDNLNEGLLLSIENRTTLDWIGYSLDGLTNKTILGDVTIPFLSNGSYSIQVFGNDSLGTIYKSEIRYFSIIIPPPSISIIIPSIDEFYSDIAPPFTISITAFYQTTTWYTLDGGIMNITFTGSSGNINQTEWDGQDEGPVTIRFYVKDSLGRLNYTETTITKDITDPVITINSPLFGEEFTTMPPRFNISVDELNIDAMWYTIDGGLTTYNISQYTGYIDSGAWNAIPNGAITIRFHVRDRAGNENYEEVIILKSAPPYIPPENSLIIIISVAIGVFIAVVGIILVVTLMRKRRARPPKPPKPPKPSKPPRPEIKIPPRQAKEIVHPSRVIVQREVMVIEKKRSERERLDRETEKRTRLEEEKEIRQVKCLYCGTLIDYYARICPKCGNEQR